MFLHAPTVIRIRRLLYAIILGRKYSIISGTNNYFYRSCQFRFEYMNDIPSYKHITLKEKYNSSEIAHECF
jgi:hypothetical protein